MWEAQLSGPQGFTVGLALGAAEGQTQGHKGFWDSAKPSGAVSNVPAKFESP